MENLLELWNNLPTAGKWGVGLGGVGLVVVVWQPWKKGSSSSTTDSSIMSPASIDYGSGLVGGGSDAVGSSSNGGSGLGNGSTIGSGTDGLGTTLDAGTGTNTGTVGGLGANTGGFATVNPVQVQTPATQTSYTPYTPVTPTTPTQNQASTTLGGNVFTGTPTQVQQAIGTSQTIMLQALSSPTPVMASSPLHQQKVGVANSVGVSVTDSGYAFDSNNNLVSNMSPTKVGMGQNGQPYINGYQDITNPSQQVQIINQITSNNNLNSTQLNQLHQAKTTAINQLGYTNQSNGVVTDRTGNVVGNLSAKATSNQMSATGFFGTATGLGSTADTHPNIGKVNKTSDGKQWSTYNGVYGYWDNGGTFHPQNYA